jgi:hypothetical protein
LPLPLPSLFPPHLDFNLPHPHRLRLVSTCRGFLFNWNVSLRTGCGRSITGKRDPNRWGGAM